jgi:membrane protease YdiL (CAAX protease family)
MQISVLIFGSIAIAVYSMDNDGDFSPTMSEGIDALYDSGLSENVVLLILLVPFAVGLLTTWALIKKMHQRTFAETVNGRTAIRWNHVFVGFGIWFALMTASLLVNYIVSPNNFVLRFDADKFIPLLIISLLFIPLQTTCEEYIFRGYIAQNIGAWTKNCWLVVVIPALLFGLLHYENTEVKEYGIWVTMPAYIIFGLFFGLVAVLDDGIELPIGIHAANNLFACLFVTHKTSSLRTSAVLEQITKFPLADTIELLVAILLALTFFYGCYKWDFGVMNRRIADEKYMVNNESN